MPSLCSSAPTVSRRSTLDQESREFFPINFGEDGKEVGYAAVGGPHFFAVEDVVLAVRRERGSAADVHSVGAGSGLRKRVGGDPFTGGELGKVALLLVVVAVPNEREGADARLRSEGSRKAGQNGDLVSDDGGGNFVEADAAVDLGMSTEVNPSWAALTSLERSTPVCFASIASVAGRISSRANCAAVEAIWRCSSVRSSG